MSTGGRGDLLDTYYAYLDSLATAIEVLLDFSWEGSSVNFKARTALNTIRDRSVDCARLIEEVKARRIKAETDQDAGGCIGCGKTWHACECFEDEGEKDAGEKGE